MACMLSINVSYCQLLVDCEAIQKIVSTRKFDQETTNTSWTNWTYRLKLISSKLKHQLNELNELKTIKPNYLKLLAHSFKIHHTTSYNRVTLKIVKILGNKRRARAGWIGSTKFRKSNCQAEKLVKLRLKLII